MQDSRYAAFQGQTAEHTGPGLQVILVFPQISSLGCGNQVDQDLSPDRGLSDQEVAQVTLFLHTVVERGPSVFKELTGIFQDHTVVFVYDPALVYGHYVIEAAPFMHAQGKGASFILIAKGELHFVPVSPLPGAGQDSFEPGKICRCSRFFS